MKRKNKHKTNCQIFSIHDHKVQKPFLFIELLSDEHASLLVSRSVSIRCVLEHWANAASYQLFHSQLQEYIAANRESAKFQQLQSASFRITVETFNKHIQQKQKIEKIETLTYLPFNGDVALKSFEVEYYYIEFYGLDPNNVPELPDHILFGKRVCILISMPIAVCDQISLKLILFAYNSQFPSNDSAGGRKSRSDS